MTGLTHSRKANNLSTSTLVYSKLARCIFIFSHHSRKQQITTRRKWQNLHYQSHCCVTSLPVLQLQQNLSVRWIPRTPGPDSLLSAPVCADAGAQCEDLQLNILETLDAKSQRFIDALRSYPGTPSTFIDTWDRVEEGVRLHVTLKNKNNDDSVEFSGVGGETKTHLRRYRLFAAGKMSLSRAIWI